jgi:hypothetical protein
MDFSWSPGMVPFFGSTAAGHLFGYCFREAFCQSSGMPGEDKPVLSRFFQAGDTIHKVVCPFYAKNRAKTHQFLSFFYPGLKPGAINI